MIIRSQNRLTDENLVFKSRNFSGLKDWVVRQLDFENLLSSFCKDRHAQSMPHASCPDWNTILVTPGVLQ